MGQGGLHSLDAGLQLPWWAAGLLDAGQGDPHCLMLDFSCRVGCWTPGCGAGRPPLLDVGLQLPYVAAGFLGSRLQLTDGLLDSLVWGRAASTTAQRRTSTGGVGGGHALHVSAAHAILKGANRGSLEGVGLWTANWGVA